MSQLILSVIVKFLCLLVLAMAALFGIYMVVTSFFVGLGKVKPKLPDWLFWWWAAGNHND